MRLDGLLSEPEWRAAAPITGLTQRDPDEGAPASWRTEVRVLYDAQRLLVGVWAEAGDPAALIARVREHDRLMELDRSGTLAFAGDDGVALLLDAALDRRSGVVLATNPVGARFDAQVSDDGRDVNVEWDAVWEVEAQRVPGGWSAEFSIPFSVLRPNGDTWGFNVYRLLRHRNEHALWAAWRRGSEDFLRVSRAGTIEGIGQPRTTAATGIELKMYALVREGASANSATPELRPTELGFDLKTELRPGVVLDATVNPDFAQADVDDEQVNLTRYDLFLPEKRGFFLENSGVFAFGVRTGGEPPPFVLFHSRRLGISASGPVRILGGARVTGRIGRQSIGVIHVETDRDSPAPYSSSTVGRLKRDVGDAGYVGAMFTRAAGETVTSATGGLDASVWLAPDLNLQGFYVRSGANSSEGDAAYSATVRYRTERVAFEGEHTYVGPDAEAALGFLARSDVRRTKGLLRLTFRPEIPRLRQVELNLLGARFTRTSGELADREAGPAVALHSDAGDWVNVYTTVGRTWLDRPFTLSGRVRVAAGSYPTRLRGLVVGTSTARAVGVSALVSEQRIYDGRIATRSLGAHVSFGDRATFEPTFTRSSASLPEGAFTADVLQMGLRYAVSNRLVGSVRMQRNSLEGGRLAQLRVEYLYRPGSELFIVLQSSRRPVDGVVLQDRRGIVKITWLHRF